MIVHESTEIKYTPWEAVEIHDANGYGMEVRDTSMDLVARPGIYNRVGIARLIAAAPELLAACNEALRVVSGAYRDADLDEKTIELKEMIWAALAKVNGEDQATK